MDWREVGGRVRKQREYMGYTREHFAELLDILLLKNNLEKRCRKW